MNDVGGADRFRRLKAEDKKKYIEHMQQMTEYARSHAVPIIIAPPPRLGGEIHGATGCIVQVNTENFIVTASHVLAKYEEGATGGKILNWQVGNLLPFQPMLRIAWRDRRRDIVFIRISEDEAVRIGPCTRFNHPNWPPRKPDVGELVIVAGYPKALREQDAPGVIGAGPYTALFRITHTGDGYCKCQIAFKDLITFCDTPVPPAGTDIGGVSGSPVLLPGSDYSLAGIVTEHGYMEMTGLELLEFATLDDVIFGEKQKAARSCSGNGIP